MELPAANAIVRADSDQLAAFWRAVVRPGEVHEVRAPKTRKGPRRWFGVVSGYFDDGEEFVDALDGADGRDAEGVYLTLNPVNPALKARAANRLQDGRPVTTQDTDVLRRSNLLVDIDPARPSGISATDGEQAAALATRDAIAAWLEDMGWPRPKLVMATGNGGGLVYAIDLANDAAATSLVERVLKGLAAVFDTPAVTVDTGTYNAARIFKVAGTVAAKGDDVPDRPWRLATAEVLDGSLPVPVELLEAVAAYAEEAEAQPTPIRPGVGRWERRDIRAALHAAGVGYREKAKSYGTVFELDRCLTSSDHTDGAVVIEMASGALAYRCLHNRCGGKSWADVRDALGFEQGGDPGPDITIGGFDPRSGDYTRPEDDQEAAETAGPVDDSAHQVEYPVPERELFYGWLGEYVNLMEPTTEAPDAFHLGVGLTVFGSMIGRRIAVDYASSPMYCNFYSVLVGASGYSRKDTAISRGLRMTELQLNPNEMLERAFQVVYDVSSAQGLIADLQANQNTMIYVSELSSLIRNARRRSTNTILPALMHAYNGLPLQNNVKDRTQRASVQAPFLSMLAATQPDVLAADMTGEDIASGFANRVLWFPGQGKEARPRPPAVNKQEAWALYERVFQRIGSYPVGIVLPMSPDTDAMWDEWYRKDREARGKDADEDSIRVRHAEYIHKVALQFAVCDGSRVVEARHLDPAMKLLDWQFEAVRVLMLEWGRGLFSVIESRIKAVLAKSGPMKRWQVQAKCKDRRWSSVEFSQVFKAMRENRIVVELPDGTVSLTPGVR